MRAASFPGAALAVGLAGSLSLPAGPPVAPRITFGHVLADFTGTVRLGEARIAIDRASGEALVAEGRDVRVFNTLGMQVFGFRTAATLGAVLDLAVTPEGDVITLASDLEAPGDRPRVIVKVHDFRGVPKHEIVPTGVSADGEEFLPNRVFWRNDEIWLASTTRWAIVVVQPDGTFLRAMDLGAILGIAAEDRHSQEITGMAVDDAGNLLLTCAVRFRAFEISPQGLLIATWGEPGSNPGMFGHAAGISRDAEGRIYVVDKNRGVVLLFDAEHRLLTEFGGEAASGSLGLPSDVVADEGRVYVTQIGRRGVWVYDVRSNGTETVPNEAR